MSGEPALGVQPLLDPGFRPLYLALREHERALSRESRTASLTLALERGGGWVSHFSMGVFEAGHPRSADGAQLVERVLKLLLWQRGAHSVYVAGAPAIASHLAARYRASAERAFDAEFFANIYQRRAFRIASVEASELPPEREQSSAVGGHFDGCRIGFDAGGSDRKVAALIDGKQVFASETPWQPKSQSDPEYHFRGIDESIRQAAAHLPRVDAIGVSSAGIYLDNCTLVASLFRAVPEPAFSARIRQIYPDIARKWGAALEVRNDGDVTALAGALSLGQHSLLGIAMGTSQAAGYVDRHGLLTGWLNELAFAPVDVAASAPLDREWSGDRGTGVNYFSQDAALRLASAAGIELDPAALPAEKLEQLQRAFQNEDARARRVFESLGVYLGYGLLLYARFYELEHVLLLGRVTSGEAGAVLRDQALAVLRREAPECAERLSLHLPDEATRRVGQAVAAASLPRLGG